MKTIVTRHLFLTVLISVFSFSHVLAQTSSYAPDEFIMMYKPETTEADRQAVRDLYSITQYAPISDDIELWTNIPFPLTVPLPDGTNEVLVGPVDMLYDVHIQEDEEGTSARANVNDGDLNYHIYLETPSEIVAPNEYSPIPFCPQEEFRIIGTPSFNQDEVYIVIFDQTLSFSGISEIDEIDSVLDDNTEGGLHGLKVASVITRVLDDAGMAGKYSIAGITVFDNQGVAKFSDIISAFDLLIDLGIEKAIINFSASMVVYDSNYGTRIWHSIQKLSEANNYLLVSSAGNDALSSENIFPGCANLPNEITVVGTENCFQDVWQNSNTNPVHFEIAAEAKNILTTINGSSWNYSHGTSYATALVTAVAAQIVINRTGLDPFEIKNQILNTSDQVPSLSPFVQEGRVLNATAAMGAPPRSNFKDNRRSNNTQFAKKSQEGSFLTNLALSQNPFSEVVEVEFSFSGFTDKVILVLANSLGKVIHQESHTLSQFNGRGQWTSPKNLPSGTYYLSVIIGNDTRQLMLIKQ